jgi:hypothetical protein
MANFTTKRRSAIACLLVACIIVMLGASALARPASRQGASLEDRYLHARDAFIQRFKSSKTPVDDEDGKALAELQTQLRSIIGSINAPDFPKDGTINLETLQQDGGLDQVDGLRFYSKNDVLFVTTTGLLKSYAATHKALPQSLTDIWRSDELFSKIFDWDSAFMRFAELPVKSRGDQSTSRAFLVLNAQDTGPYVPNTVIVVAVQGDRVALIKSDARPQPTQIPACVKEWDRYEAKATAARDKKAFDESNRLEDQGFTAYRTCFGDAVATEAFYSSLVSQAQSMMARLQQFDR